MPPSELVGRLIAAMQNFRPIIYAANWHPAPPPEVVPIVARRDGENIAIVMEEVPIGGGGGNDLTPPFPIFHDEGGVRRFRCWSCEPIDGDALTAYRRSQARHVYPAHEVVKDAADALLPAVPPTLAAHDVIGRVLAWSDEGLAFYLSSQTECGPPYRLIGGDVLMGWEARGDRLAADLRALGVQWAGVDAADALTVKEAADLCGVTSGAVTKWSNAGRFKNTGIGRERRIDRADYLRFMVARRAVGKGGGVEPTESDEAVERKMERHAPEPPVRPSMMGARRPPRT